MRRLPREKFLPPELAPVAYADAAVRLPGGPGDDAAHGDRSPDPARPPPRIGERALVAGCGAGYGAAVMAGTGASVLALEEDEALLAAARVALPRPRAERGAGRRPDRRGLGAGRPVRRHPAGRRGARHPRGAGGAARAGAGPAGDLVLVGKGRSGMAVLAEPTEAGLRAQPMFDCSTPPIASLLPAPGFVFLTVGRAAGARGREAFCDRRDVVAHHL